MVHYIWQLPSWPNFRWNSDALLRPLGQALPFTHKLALPTIVTFECEAVTHQL